MKKLITVLVLLSVVTPVHAGMIMKQDPIESDLVTQAPQGNAAEQKNKQLEQDMSSEYKKPAEGPEKSSTMAAEKSGLTWWKWVLGIAVVGGVAASAGGNGGGGDGGPAAGGTGGISAGW